MHTLPRIGLLLLTGYILTFIFLNLLAYLISSFYQQKFDQPSPRRGFIIAVIAALLYDATLFAGTAGPSFLPVARVLLLFAAAIGSASSAVALYYTMKRVRK